jgi:uncharacterized protein
MKSLINLCARNQVFRNSYGHLRAGWRIGLYLLILIPSLLPGIGVLKLAGWLFHLSGGKDLASPINIIFVFVVASGLAIAAYTTLRWVDKRPYELLGLNVSLTTMKELISGFAIGAGNLVGVVLVLSVLGFLKISWNGIDFVIGRASLSLGLVFIGGAAIEELANRGYIFQALCEGTRPWIAVFATSLVFSVVHMSNQHMSTASILFLFVHGILYAVAYLKTRSLWTAISVHWAWNWMQGPVCGIPVSGSVISNSLFTAQPQGPDIFSGGQFGVEGSIFASLISLGMVAFVWRTKWLAPTEKMAALWDQYPGNIRSHLNPEANS